MNSIINIKSVSETHQMLGLGKPRHPLVSVFNNDCLNMDLSDACYSSDLYIISMKEGVTGKMSYGRSSYDFEEGTMVFMSPGQVMTPAEAESTGDSGSYAGWTLIFHPDLIRKSQLGRKIGQYTFFSYDVNEALHLSEDEKQTLNELADKIRKEINQNIDRHTQHLIAGNIELLLDYCTRYYDRQFYTRTNASEDIVSAFEHLLIQYYNQDKALESGIPTVAYCGQQLGISPNYLSDLLKKETGRSARDHIHFFIIDRAKTQLLGTNQPISQIAYGLGFDYPAHFTKLFKKNTGVSPSQFRVLN
ncbi:helix-turn-helix domain-containing protein [Photobacterium kasasachensis]|uniref:helix-turn-helix domain-containing protein n=2 Tax=Photobacterium TaxID=657 RepID=UPI003D11FBC2